MLHGGYSSAAEGECPPMPTRESCGICVQMVLLGKRPSCSLQTITAQAPGARSPPLPWRFGRSRGPGFGSGHGRPQLPQKETHLALLRLGGETVTLVDRKSTRLNSSHLG